MTPLFSGAVFSAIGRSTWEAASIVTEVVTMKMMSRTRKMSVSGVMLICQNISPLLFGPLTANGLSPLQCGVDQAVGAAVGGGGVVFALGREVVVEKHPADPGRHARPRPKQNVRAARRRHPGTSG